jgi:hypothetical protein
VPRAQCRAAACFVIVCVAGLTWNGGLRAHEIPTDVTAHVIVKPDGDQLRLLVRVPLEAMQDVEFPTFGPGYLDIRRAEPRLRDAATVWLANAIEVYEGGRPLGRPALRAVRASVPSDRSFTGYDSALAHVLAPPLSADTQIVWQQALLDVLLDVPIDSQDADFSIRPNLQRLGLRVTTALRFVAPDGAVRVFELAGDPGVVPLDPRWSGAALRFVRQGFRHILGGADHLLFLLCLVMPLRRELRALVGVATAFTVAHSTTLIASAYGLAPDVLWFGPLIETLIAASIFYMAVENVVAANVQGRWALAFGFGLVHGFGFSFALRNTLQFAGDHVLTSLLSFNIGVELGQVAVLVLMVAALNAAYRFVASERLGTVVVSVIVAHTAWHRMAERFAVLRQFDVGWADLYAAAAGSGLVWLAGGLVAAGTLWLAVTRSIGKRRTGREAAAGAGRD